jgi:superfamily II DNA or RNA helicase
MNELTIELDLNSLESYRQFLAAKQLPAYRVEGRRIIVPAEYAGALTGEKSRRMKVAVDLHPGLFDYQRDISKLAIEKGKFAIFADCGLGKTLMLLEFARHARRSLHGSKRVLIVSPLMVVAQTMGEAERFYPGMEIEQVKAAKLGEWMRGQGGIGITNYDALTDEITQGNLGALILDESSMLKSHYGKWGQKCLELGRGLEWKLCATGTPAPNDRIEYANHAVFLDHFPTINSFLARYFVNRGQTQERWELKPHALKPFYRSLSHWCIFLTNPATYGWKDNCESIPPIHTHIEHVDLTPEQDALLRKLTGKLVVTELGGITSRATMGQLAKGSHKGESIPTNKYTAIKAMVDQWPDESTIIWCHYNDEQESCAAQFPDAANIDGSTPHAKRMELIADFKAGRRKVLISKGRILGFGLNLQIATRQVFSGLQDSYEEFYQCVKRSNRYGSTRPLNVHIPVSDIERPMIDNVLRKAARVQADTEAQEELFSTLTGGLHGDIGSKAGI